MSIISKTRPFRQLLAAVLLLPLTTACSSGDTDGLAVAPTPEIATSNHYINLNIVVSSGNEGAMRVPTASGDNYEDGDGRENGSERENKVTGVTFMLYPVTQKSESTEYNGINESQDVKLAFVKYYSVKEDTGGTLPEKIEKVYTTGPQSLKGLNLSDSYRAIVVANCDMTPQFSANTTTVKEVCDKAIKEIYTGKALGANASNFVMCSETDSEVITFTNPTEDGSQRIYETDPIRIERLAARVDFWMNGATYTGVTYDENTKSGYVTAGYLYNVKKSSGAASDDQFVLTGITPFNLYNGTATEYLIKRLNNGGSDTYLARETQTNFVIDPNTGGKSLVENTTLYDNRLAELAEIDQDLRDKEQEPTLASVTDYYQATASLRTSEIQKATFTGDNEKDNFILCYPKENTLNGSSSLYYYATGVAIEGDYYTKNATGGYEREHRVYYGYLRHRGEQMKPGETTYKIKAVDGLEKNLPSNTGVAMNFGVVRNNIYRISIDEITDKNNIVLQIKVKKWDEFIHDTIYM